MRICPVMALRGGRVEPSAPEAEPGDPPEAHARAWRAAGARRLHVVDLDARAGGAPQWMHVQGVLRAGLPVQFSGGVRTMVQIQQILELGTERVVVGSKGVQHPEWARELGIIFPGRVVLHLEAAGREVALDGAGAPDGGAVAEGAGGVDVAEVVRGLDDAGLGGFLYDDRAGSRGVDRQAVQDLRDAARRSPLMVACRAPDGEALEALAGVGVDVAVVDGGLDVAEATRRYEGMVA